MPFATKADLKSAIEAWMDRTDITGNADEFISLAEAGLNREIRPIDVDTTLTGTSGNQTISIAGLGIREAKSLFLVDLGREWPLRKMNDGDFGYVTAAGRPAVWSIDTENIHFERPLGQDYTFRLNHKVNYALDADSDTNWLLTNHPDVYLSASITWGATFVADDATRQRYGGPLSEFISSINRQDARRNRGKLGVDAGLAAINWRRYWPWGVYR